LGRFAPRLADKIMEKTMIKQQQSNRPAGARQEHGLYRSSGELQERGGYVGHVAESSLYTRASLHPLLTGSALVGAGLAVAALLRAKRAGADSIPEGGEAKPGHGSCLNPKFRRV
jgi:hypothetical protein